IDKPKSTKEISVSLVIQKSSLIMVASLHNSAKNFDYFHLKYELAKIIFIKRTISSYHNR
ncbi:MAG: hypothetical protein ACTS8R_01095, partial [Arsenophonus sp. NC-QC1-MAG3]